MTLNRKKVYIPLILLLALTLLFYLLTINSITCTDSDHEEPPEELLTDDFGIDLNRYRKESRGVRPHETLGRILNDAGIAFTIIESISEKLKPDFEVRNIRAGNTCHLYYAIEADSVLRYFVYEITNTKYFKVSFSDTLTAEVIENEIRLRLSGGKGIIKSSLWNAMKGGEMDPVLASKLSEIYAWEIDFYRIQRDDSFKVLYEKKYVGTNYIGTGSIRAALFTHSGKDFYAFFFEEDTIKDYFNHEAQSLRKAFLKAPLKYSRISSGFSNSRLHPVLRTRRPHYGTDYAAPTGTPIMAVGDGVVTEARYHGGNGNYVRIRHNSVYETQYLHMSRFAAGIRPGVRVSQGDIIGYVGMTGLATGPHVCFRFWKNGQQVNHLKEAFPHAAPLDSVYHGNFFELRDFYMQGFERLVFEKNN